MLDGVRALGRGFWTVLRHAAQPTGDDRPEIYLPANLLSRKICTRMQSMFTKLFYHRHRQTPRTVRAPQPQPRMRWY